MAVQTSYIYHLLSGISLPLAILAVRGMRRLHVPKSASVLAVIALTLPDALYQAEQLAGDIRERKLAHTVSSDESRALAYLERSQRPGGVLGPVSIAQTVPVFTGRRTWVGHPTWTPHFLRRYAEAERLFAGELDGPEARAFVRSTEQSSFLPIVAAGPTSNRSFARCWRRLSDSAARRSEIRSRRTASKRRAGVTPGLFDHRPYVERYGLPADLS